MPPSRTSQSLASLAERFGLELRGDGKATIDRVGTLADAGPDALTFLANRAYRDQLSTTRAGAVILRESDAADCPVPCFIAPDPYLAYARMAVCFDHRPAAAPGVHDSARVHPGARLGADVAIGPCAVIGDGARIGDGAEIGPGCVLAEDVVLGAGCRLVANVTLGHGVRLGQRVLVHPGAVIGADGFGIARGPDGWEKVPQLGSVRIGDDCEIGANTCIDRGAIGDTVLEEDVRLDNHVQIGHNCHVGAHTAMAAYVGISGSTEIGRNCLFAGRSGAHGHIRIADNVVVSAMTMVQKPITEPGTTWAGAIPAQPIREWHKILGELRRLRTTLTALRGKPSSEGKNNE
ncbi:MAG: UDP-3-O-(3-hydroxymyristoyl)glucosamine N-acyltransferase [Xanthomonadales bacterium]|jgi:UDP-3-O-[3-hydroxymyristoyl] glucosamine N-acyltransferase|nr:UDP-3-O-(3-hydroxymyristoyl)glucosamine N-acyltransferase [Xanthomonadales bacterium]